MEQTRWVWVGGRPQRRPGPRQLSSTYRVYRAHSEGARHWCPQDPLGVGEGIWGQARAHQAWHPGAPREGFVE